MSRARSVPSQTTREVADLSLLQNVFAVHLVIYPHTHDERFLKAKNCVYMSTVYFLKDNKCEQNRKEGKKKRHTYLAVLVV